MIDLIAKWVTIFFGIFFICVGFLMLLKPQISRAILRKAGSTNFINYAEITVRMIPAVGLILSAENSKYPDGTPVPLVAFWNEYGTRTAPPRPFFPLLSVGRRAK